ncbi:wall-associated receptor kinase-like 20 [Mercurialis annua]|uniref:wall-associated receptor kinase-like 20 n=1 Tax=Mercurialis annua TaxID=3986 RepID=UPI0021604F6B|nr:wall-associated receptor kinase-like 20 [Mercurialis annua]
MYLVFLILSLVLKMSTLEACPKCGSMEVPYPLSTAENCGDSRYRIYCNNGALQFLSSQGFYYKILSINPRANKLVIAPPAIQKNTCHSSDVGLGGLMLDDKLPFNISNRNTVMLFNCSVDILKSPLNCSASSFCREFEEENDEGGCKGTLCCHFLKDSAMTSHRIRVRTEGCTAYTCVVDMKAGDPVGVWNYGIELQWLPPYSMGRV